MTDIDKINEISNHSLDFMKLFEEKVDLCKDSVEYCALVASLFVFKELVLSSFSYSFLNDGTPDQLKAVVDVMDAQGKVIAAPTIKKWNEENLQ
jgi:hypothetical protein